MTETHINKLKKMFKRCLVLCEKYEKTSVKDNHIDLIHDISDVVDDINDEITITCDEVQQ